MELCQGILLQETLKANLIRYEGDEQWVPVACIPYILRQPIKEDGTREISFKLLPWKAKELGWD